MFESGKFSDFEIDCQGKKLKVHKAIITSQGGYFDNAITKRFKVSYGQSLFSLFTKSAPQEGHENKLELPNEDYDVLLAVIKHLYGILYTPPESSKGALFHASVYSAGEYYQLASLKKGKYTKKCIHVQHDTLGDFRTH